MTPRFSVVSSIALLAISLATTAPAFAADLKIAIVDLARAASESPHAESARKKIDREFRDRDRTLIAKQKAIRSREEKLVRSQATMSEDQLRKENRDLRQLKREFQRELGEFNEDRNVRNNEELQKLQRVVIEVTQELAQSDKIDLVLIRGVVVFADEKKLDITDRVLAQLKQRFKRGNDGRHARVELSLGEIAVRLQAELRGGPEVPISRVDTLDRAGTGAISFFSNRRYRRQLLDTAASAVLINAADADDCPVAALVMDNPYLGYARVAAWLNPPAPFAAGVHASAVVAGDARVDASAWIGPHCVVESGAAIAADAYVGPGCVIGAGARIGVGTRLVARVTVLDNVTVGARVVMHPGVVLGAQGFGIANDDGVWVNIPQLGRVIIGDDVDIGANTCIDRGALEDTIIERGVKIDNHVQIGHNVVIGEHTAIAGCVAIAGSARIGARCTIGGTSAVSGHLEIVDDVHLTGGTNVPNSIREPGVYSSTLPLQSNRDWRRNMVRVKQLDELARRVRALENKK